MCRLCLALACPLSTARRRGLPPTGRALYGPLRLRARVRTRRWRIYLLGEECARLWEAPRCLWGVECHRLHLCARARVKPTAAPASALSDMWRAGLPSFVCVCVLATLSSCGCPLFLGGELLAFLLLQVYSYFSINNLRSSTARNRYYPGSIASSMAGILFFAIEN